MIAGIPMSTKRGSCGPHSRGVIIEWWSRMRPAATFNVYGSNGYSLALYSATSVTPTDFHRVVVRIRDHS